MAPFCDDVRMISVRSSRRPWADLRFLIGLALIAASVGGVWLVVSAARQTAPVLQATRVIVPGQALTSADVRVVDVALAAAGDRYLTPTSLEPGSVATRTIENGELVPAAATAPADSTSVTSIVVDSTIAVPPSIVPGSVVEVWTAPPLPDGPGFAPPRILLADATVAAVTREESMLGGSRASLELVVDRAEVGDVLGAITDGSAMSVVPVRKHP